MIALQYPRNAFVAALGALLVGSCGAQPLNAQTNGVGGGVTTAAQIFESMLAQLRAQQQKEPWDPRGRQSNPYQLLEVQIEDWYATEEGRFAHSIKIPNPVPAESGYRPGMTQQEYFEHLCKNEAGEFIFNTVDNVEGIFQLRPRKAYTAAERQHLYAIEDPYGYWIGETEDVGFEFVTPLLYSYLEIPPWGRRMYGAAMRELLDPSIVATPPVGATIARHYGYDNQNVRSMRLEFDTKSRARYGFTWRGIRRPHDRELGIAGGELIVFDLKTYEVMGVRRGYNVWNRGWTGRMCPRYGYSGGQDKTTYFTSWFIAKVVRPPRWNEFFAREEKGRRIVGNPNDKRY